MHSFLLNSKFELISSFKILKTEGLSAGINLSIFLIILMNYLSIKINYIEKRLTFPLISLIHLKLI